MLSTSTLRHLRIPFSYFLLPVFLFALAVSPNLILERLQWVFVILHFLVYPASNGYNSYFDKDEQSIGGLKYPPPVSRELYWTALGLDVLAVMLSVNFVSLDFAVMVTVYGLASKAYSHPWIRLKKYPVYGWLVTGFFQGFFTFLMCYMGLNKYGLSAVTQTQVLLPATLTSFMLWANYPMTQVYQHEEDARHGDRTLSRMLGVRGTFGFSAAFFGLTAIGFVLYFNLYFSLRQSLAFLCALVPVVGYFGFWFWQVWMDSAKADYTRTMRLNFVSATSLVIFFTWLLLDARNVGRYLFG
jgi:1,4-dihydroxy-2-naphthoate octaprenyltransferase